MNTNSGNKRARPSSSSEETGIPLEEFEGIQARISGMSVLQLAMISNLISIILDTKGYSPPSSQMETLSVRSTPGGGQKASGIPKGESGSGYSRTKSGKLVRNKRSKERPLYERQARNWREKATQAVVAYLQSVGVPKGTIPPPSEEWDILDRELANAKAYQAYIKKCKSDGVPNDDIEDVRAWRESTLVSGAPSGASDAVASAADMQQ